jgi:DNA-binding SARP family transcriptional activator/tetratricopeptide (TPR) repeat protein
MAMKSAGVTYAVLGDLRARRADGLLPLGGYLQRALLALLLTERGRVVSVDRIVAELWPDAAPDDPAASVQTYVSRLRRLLEPGRVPGGAPTVVVRVGNGYRLDVPADAVDAERFTALAQRARRALEAGRPDEAGTAAADALALWHGAVALEEFTELAFTAAVRTRLAEQRLSCEEDLADALIARHRAPEAVLRLEALTAAEPLRERPWLLLMTALHASGRSADALDRFQQVRRLLDEELGLRPGPDLCELQARILRQDVDPPPSPPSPPPAPTPGPATAPTPGPATAPAPGPPAAPTDGLVGRASERAQLHAVVDDLDRTGARFVLVEGEAGIGKSRLVGDLADHALPTGAAIGWGRCHEDADAPAFWPWRQALSDLGRSDPALRPAQDGGFGVFEHVLERLTDVARHRRVVVVIEDLHWADSASLRLLAFLAVELRTAPVAVIATCRVEERPPVVVQVASTLSRSPGFLRLTLGALDPEQTHALAAQVLAGRAALDAETLAGLHARTGGNPFFIGELARFLADRPADRDRAGRGGTELPASVRDVVTRRTIRLPEPAQRTLRLAAVLGERFELPVLLRASSVESYDMIDGLDAALAAQVLTADNGRFAFAHALVRDTLLAGMTELQRRRLHATLAGAVRDRGDGTERAYHLVHGRPFTDGAEAFDAARAAGDRALGQFAYEDAAIWYQHALDVVAVEPSLDIGTRRTDDLLLRLGQAYSMAGRSAAAQEQLLAAVDAALARGNVATAAEAAAALGGSGGIWFWVPYGTYPADAVHRLEATLAAVADDDLASRVRVLAALAIATYHGPDTERADRTTAQALALARRHGDPAVLAEALTARLFAIWRATGVDEQAALIEELLHAAAAAGLDRFGVFGYIRRAVLGAELVDLPGAEADHRRAAELAQRVRLPLFQAQLIRLQAAHATARGQFARAEELIEQASLIMQRLQLTGSREIDLLLTGYVRREQGRFAEFAATLLDRDWLIFADSPLEAVCHIQAGDRAAATAMMARTDGYAPAKPWWDWLARTCVQAEVAAEMGAAEVAGELADRLAPFAERIVLYGSLANLGPVARYLGRVEALAGRVEAAERHLRQAVAIAAKHGLRPSLADASLHLAELLRRRGDTEEAPEHLERAATIARELDLRRITAAVRRVDPGPATVR